MPAHKAPHELPAEVRTRVEAIADDAARQVDGLAAGFEFASYLCGTRPPEEGDLPPDVRTDDFRAALRFALRARLAEQWPARRFDGVRPEMIVVVVPRGAAACVSFEPAAVFVAARYRKLARGLSQTVFHCRRCRGKGTRRGTTCEDCAGSGRVVPEAVEDFVRPVIESACEGHGSAFHGAGREDVDVRMLGSGRPFVVSVESPRSRSPDDAAVAALVRERSGGRVEIEDLRVVDRMEMQRITMEHGAKTYRVVVRPTEGELPPDSADRLATLGGATLAQRTPQRVDRRRADRVRERAVRALTVEACGPGEALLTLHTDPGLYVKEFVSGDEGRTTPSVSDVLGVPCVCAELDVLAVGDPLSSP